MHFYDLIGDVRLIKALEALGFTIPTPIQQQAIPHVLSGNDVRGAAQTGSGKTAAFLLPILQRLASTPYAGTPRALILVPTRELAMQVDAEAKKLCQYLPLKTVCLYGGVPYPAQNRQLAKKHDLLIATPGRLIDHLEQRRVNLSKIEIFVLDEADRMLDMGFIEPVEHITSLIPPTRQTLMFSATYGKRVLQLAQRLLRNPVDVSVDSEEKKHEQIEQHIHHVDSLEHKYKLLEQFVTGEVSQQTIVFSSTKMQTEKIADRLCDSGFNATFLHGDLNQRQRSRTMQMVRDGKVDILVATDVAARGIDINTITHVINFDLPHCLEDYIHRIGRTGRAGNTGTAHSFASSKDRQIRREIEQFAGLQTIGAPTCATADDEKPRKARPRRPFKQARSGSNQRYGQKPQSSQRQEAKKPARRGFGRR